LAIDHSVSSGGYFCQVFNRQPLSKEELSRLEERMRELVEKNYSISKERVPIQKAIDFFYNQGHDDKVRLLNHRKKDYLVLYDLNGYKDYHHGYMIPSTGYLKWFALQPTNDGFTLQFPRRHMPMTIQKLPDYSTLLETFREYGSWIQSIGIDDVGSLNDAIAFDRIREVVLVAEALHEQRIASIARQIAQNVKQIKIILVAGPSSSGKTTFSKRLTIQLLAHGLSPFPLEMDNFFVDREETPRDESGEFDFESIRAIDSALLTNKLNSLIQGKETQLPNYDFISGMKSPGKTVKLAPGQIIILEGIHGLNPELLPGISPDKTFKIYASALTQLNLDRHNRVSTTDTRLIRRIIRDARERGYTAKQTIGRWESVRRGEKRYIFPYQENADVMFNSALVYELSALSPLAEPLLRQVPFGSVEYIEAKRLLTFLEWFKPIDVELIPDNSILREFIGHSILKDFHLWQR
jgi:uridine kinase